VESHAYAIRQKAEIMVDHFHEQVLAKQKVGGQARAMVVTSGIERAIQYYHAFVEYLQERKSPYKAIVAFSGEHEFGNKKVTEASLNVFPSSKIPDYFKAEKVKDIHMKDPYRFLIVADKFQTGYDEPLLHTMYVDKPLSGIKAVQTLSRLNRADPRKHDTFVLDFQNDADTIQKAFEPYYHTTILSEETDPNKLHDLKADLDGYQVYSWSQVEELVSLYVSGADRDRLDPILDTCVATYNEELNEDGQVDFKGKAKAFVRTHGFLASILPYTNADWERLSTFLNFLIPKLPAPKEEDLSKGILETVDMDSYRIEVRSSLDIALPDKDAEIGPVPTSGGGRMREPEIDRLSSILKVFNDQFGNIDWKDVHKIRKVISEEIPARVAANQAYQNAKKNSDRQNARIEHDNALQRVMTELLADHTELFKQFSDNPSFRKWLSDTVFGLTYEAPVEIGSEATRYPVEQAENLIRRQFGAEEKWVRINHMIWNYFKAHKGKRLGLSEIRRIASSMNISIDDVLSVLSVLAGPRQEFIRRVYYQRASAGQGEEVPPSEIIRQTRRWWFEKEIDDAEWEHWAGDVLVGWEPVLNQENALPTS
jgi:type I restriction enzyme R subunit